MKIFLLLLIPASILVLYTVIYLYQGKLIFFPSNQNFQDCKAMDALKAQSIETDYQGERIRFYLKESEAALAYMIIYHGNAGSACDRAYYLQDLTATKLNIVVAEYPGYSNDATSPSEARLLANATKIFQYIESRDTQNRKIFVYGESLGTAIATKVAAENNVAGLILQSPFPALSDIANIHYPNLPVNSLLRHTFPAKDWAQNVKAKTLVLIGSKDEIIPPQLSNKQAQNFLNLLQVVTFEGYGHNDLHNENEDLWHAVNNFIHDIIFQK